MNFPINEIEKFYPGINQKRLQEEFQTFFELQRLKGFYSRGYSEIFFIQKLKAGMPLEYITEQAYFYNSWFYVNENVLIPRFESEGLIELVKKKLRGNRLCEVGCGSGCLGLSLLKELQSPVSITLLDISDPALEVTRYNLNTHKYSWNSKHSVEILKSDRLYSVLHKKFDLIFSNPPYIKRSQPVHFQVLKFEPDIALFLEDDEYEEWFSIFFSQAILISNSLILEGHEENLEELEILARKCGYKKTELHKDLSGRHRYLELHVVTI